MITPETQAFLTETKAPTVSPAQVIATLKTLLNGIGNYQAEIATQIRLLNAAMIAETDINVVAQLDLQSQILGALRREVSELEDNARDLVKPLDQYTDYQETFRTMAAPLGYVV